MSKPTISPAERRIPIALGLMAFVLALLGSQHASMGSGDSRPVGQISSLAAASATTR